MKTYDMTAYVRENGQIVGLELIVKSDASLECTLYQVGLKVRADGYDLVKVELSK